MTRPLRRVGLHGYVGSGNLGNDASHEAVLTWIRSTHPHPELRRLTIAPNEIGRERPGVQPRKVPAWLPT